MRIRRSPDLASVDRGGIAGKASSAPTLSRLGKGAGKKDNCQPVKRLTPLLVLVLVASALPFAFAQPRSRGKKEPKTSEPAEVRDAGATSSGVVEPSQAASDGGAAFASDGGAWTSPLTPRPEEFPQKGAEVPADYDRILADIAALRARVATASDAVFKSRLAVALRAGSGNARIKKLRIALDDGTVYTASGGFRAEQAQVVFDRALSPGRHVLTFDVETEDARDRTFATSQITRMPIDVPRDHRLQVEARLEDDSGMAGSFPGSKKGSYDLRLRLKAEATQVK